MSKHTPHTVKVNLENNTDQTPKKDGQSKKPNTRQPTPLQWKATVWRGQNKHGLKKIKHALLSSQETTTQPVQAPKTRKDFRSLFRRRCVCVSALLCLHISSSPEHSPNRRPFENALPPRGEEPARPAEPSALTTPAHRAAPRAYPTQEVLEPDGQEEEGKTGTPARSAFVSLGPGPLYPCRGVLVTAWGESACIPCNITTDRSIPLPCRRTRACR